ncbi:hypothetical protein E2562_017798 [Oryza meyeriana var. granulata]|uniref:Uncharacterized protein n=1 Tax=Oryza meyeriana var. granulata TaxID=110450 RepID=A0A6G1BN30_9ORYZ|nr:hypothetical protein E2562_017798 [Oryza meyeriana var. granulata]
MAKGGRGKQQSGNRAGGFSKNEPQIQGDMVLLLKAEELHVEFLDRILSEHLQLLLAVVLGDCVNV